MWVQLRVWCRTLTPQYLVTKLMGFLSMRRWGAVTRWAIRRFVDHFQVDLSLAETSSVEAFPAFHDFFIRRLRAGVRPVVGSEEAWVSPVDGTWSVVGHLEKGALIQAKGHTYTLSDLLASEEWASRFSGGQYATFYLSPKDYHRIHMPVAGRLTAMRYIPGRFFSVDDFSVAHVPRVFARNERVVSLFETAEGPLAMVAVGAMIVGSVSTSWHGVVRPRRRRLTDWSYQTNAPTFKRGEEMGYFSLGSTVIIVRAGAEALWSTGVVSQSVVMGQCLNDYLSNKGC